MDAARFPNLCALLEGRLIMRSPLEWPAVKTELAAYEQQHEALRRYAATLLEVHEHQTPEEARATVERAIR